MINEQTITVDIPYRVALGIITLASGSTDLDGAIHVRNYKPSFEPRNLNRSRKATMMTELRTMPETGVFPGGIEYQQAKERFPTLGKRTRRNTHNANNEMSTKSTKSKTSKRNS